MEREIKFRVWINNGMVYSDNIYGDVDDEYLIALNGDMVYMRKESNGNYCPDGLVAKLIHKKILMQYTGLKDKNGKEIYEGDTVKDWVSGTHWIVKFGRVANMGYTGWYCINHNFVSIVPLNGDYDTNKNSKVEIIGNIYETTPELIPPTLH